jgi:hypothetical protein
MKKLLPRMLRRRGSVLILCVVLIVVLALIGTAMLSRARIDRGTTVQNTNNTQIELLVEGGRNLAKTVIINDLYDGGIFRPAENAPFPAPDPNQSLTPPTRNTSFDNWDASSLIDNLPSSTFGGTVFPNGSRNDSWLATRLPVIPQNPAPAAPDNMPYWPAITAPFSSLGGTFDSPFVLNGNEHTGFGTIAPATVSTAYTQHASFAAFGAPIMPLEPDFIREVRDSGGTVINTFNPPLPAWTLTLPGDGTKHKFIAADADGDGIADAGLQKLPIGTINGLTYFIGVRIIDNNSAINVNTALRRDADYDAAGALLPNDAAARVQGMFPTSIGLVELLKTQSPNLWTASESYLSLGAEMDALNMFRAPDGQNGNTVKAPIGVATANGSGSPPNPGPVGDDGQGNMSFQYNSVGDALSMSLGRRLDHPGFVFPDPGGANQFARATRIPAADTAALAYHNGAQLNPSASPGTIENLLPDSTYKTVRKTPYRADGVIPWFNAAFNFEMETNPGSFLPRRPILVSSNPVSNQMPKHDMNLQLPYGVEKGKHSSYRVEHLPNPGAEQEKMPDYSLLPATGTPPDPSTEKPERPAARAAINTADFGTLWRAYWNVMVDQTTGLGTPFVPPQGLSAGYGQATYYGSHFAQSQYDETPQSGRFAPETIVAGTPETWHPQRMFRSILRDPRGSTPNSFMMPDQVMLLRSALAAANTEALRNHENDRMFKHVVPGLAATINNGTATVNVRLAGYKPQPFITEVYANTDNVTKGPGNPGAGTLGAPNPKGYIAVELYNPYPFDISLKDWFFVIVDRRDNGALTVPTQGDNLYGAATGLHVVYLKQNNMPWKFGATDKVKAHSYLVVDNFNGGDATDFAAVYQPQGTPTDHVYAPNLHWVCEDKDPTGSPGTTLEAHGGELVLMRPTTRFTNEPDITVQEAVPVDSFDFTGLLSADRSGEINNPPGGGGGTGGTGATLRQVGPPGPGPVPANFFSWHYVRSSTDQLSAGGPLNVNDKPNWKFVYPGRYNGTPARTRQQGTEESIHNAEQGNPEGTFNPPVRLGQPDKVSTYPMCQHTIQLGNVDDPGAFPIGSGPTNRFPFGGFARNGDMLQVPYIGGYVVTDAAGHIFELNAITLDAAFAEDTDPSDDELPTDTGAQRREAVGRFMPIVDTSAGANNRNDLDPTGTYKLDDAAVAVKWNYRWATDFFDYLTVQSPNDDYFPNMPKSFDAAGNGSFGAFTSTTTAVLNGQPQPPPAVPNREWEETEPIEGLININTAPWVVLKQIPWVPVIGGKVDNFTFTPGNDTVAAMPDGIDDNAQLAQKIVEFRDGSPAGGQAPQGPFTSLFDLYRCNAFRNFNQELINLEGTEATDQSGDISPIGPALDSVRFDSEEQMLALTRVSNLITTRSDSFTVYIVVQGWRIDPQRPEVSKLEVQRRAAFIIDRSNLEPSKSLEPKIINVPND